MLARVNRALRDLKGKVHYWAFLEGTGMSFPADLPDDIDALSVLISGAAHRD